MMKVINKVTKLQIVKAFSHYKRDRPDFTRFTITNRLVEIFGVSERSIRDIVSQGQDVLKSSICSIRAKTDVFLNYTFRKDSQRQIWQYHLEDEHFTLDKLLAVSRENLEYKNTMLPIQKSQFLAQCTAYIRLNEQLARMIQNLIPEQPDQCNHHDQPLPLFDSLHQSYLNQHIRALHSPSVQDEQGNTIYLDSNNEIIEEPQVYISSIIPTPVQYSYTELPTFPPATSSDSSETLCSLDVQIALQEKVAQEVLQPEPIPASTDIIPDILNLPNSPLLEDTITGEWNLESLFDCVSDSDSTESLIIDTDYESEKEATACQKD